jgi:RimJ/RimL family protein N-acetyltransferase
MNAMPVIETPRLRLRPFVESDLNDLARLNADPRVMQFLGTGRTFDRVQTWQQLALVYGHQQLRGYTLMVIEDRDSGAFVGRTGPWFPVDWPMLEVGWVIDPAHQGKGLASEAGRAMVDWCFANLSVEEVCSMILPGNAASTRVAEKLGARHRGRTVVLGKEADVWIHSRLATIEKPVHPCTPDEHDDRFEIRTNRFRLRPFRERDLDELSRLYSDPDVMRYIAGGKTLDRGLTWRAIAGFLGHRQMRGYGTLAIEDQRTGVFVGECGPAYREDLPHIEVGWLVDPRRQGQGIATEVAQAAVEWCFANLKVNQLCSVIHPKNAPSIRVATKLGAVRQGEIPIHGGVQELWVHSRTS